MVLKCEARTDKNSSPTTPSGFCGFCCTKSLDGVNVISLLFVSQEDANRGKPNWEHLSDDLHVLITVEDSENRARMKLARAVEEVQKLLVPVSCIESPFSTLRILIPFNRLIAASGRRGWAEEASVDGVGYHQWHLQGLEFKGLVSRWVSWVNRLFENPASVRILL